MLHLHDDPNSSPLSPDHQLEQQIQGCIQLQKVEDLYGPYKEKRYPHPLEKTKNEDRGGGHDLLARSRRKTLASAAIEKGLLPLATKLVSLELSDQDFLEQAVQAINEEKGLRNVEDVLEGVRHIVAEMVADNPDVPSPCLRASSRNQR